MFRAEFVSGQIDDSIAAGMTLFSENCSFCHYTDRKETKVGPGLKGLFQGKELPVSQKPVNAETIQQQLKTPFRETPPLMPPSRID